MPLNLSPEFAQSYFGELIRMIAQKLGIKDWEWKSAIELLEEFGQKFPKTYEALVQFMEIYNIWIKAVNKSGVMSDELQEKISLRDAARLKLIQAVKNRI